MFKKVLVWGCIAYVIFFVAFRPSAAADVIRTLGEVTGDILAGVGDFFSGLVG